MKGTEGMNKLREQKLDETSESDLSMKKLNENTETNTTLNSTRFSGSPSKSPTKLNNEKQKIKSNNNNNNNKNRVAFNLSLFDPGSSLENENSFLMNLSNQNKSNNNNTSGGGGGDVKGENTTLLKTTITNDSTYNSINDNVAFKTSLIQKALKKTNYDTRKKWFDILADESNQSLNNSTKNNQINEHNNNNSISFKSLDDLKSNLSISQGMLNTKDDGDSLFGIDHDTSNEQTLSSTSSSRSNRKIASKTAPKQPQQQQQQKLVDIKKPGVKVDVSIAQTNLSIATSDLKISTVECTKEIKLHTIAAINNNVLEKSLKQYSPPQSNAIMKEVIKIDKNCDKDINPHANFESLSDLNVSLSFFYT